MFSIFKRSKSTNLPVELPPPAPQPRCLSNSYQVSSTSKKDIHPIKREKLRASITAKERSDLWKRFQNLNLTDFHYQDNSRTVASTDLDDNLSQKTYNSILRKQTMSTAHKSALKKSISFCDTVTERKINNTQGTMPRYASISKSSRSSFSKPVIHDVRRIIPLRAHDNVPRRNTVHSHYDVPRANAIPAYYDVPKANAVPSHYNVPRANAIPAYYDVPKANAVPSHYNVPRANAIPAHYDIPKTSAISMNCEFSKTQRDI